MAAFLGSVVSLNLTLKCLYNAASLSRFTLCFNRKVDVASVVSGYVNDVSSTLLVFGVP